MNARGPIEPRPAGIPRSAAITARSQLRRALAAVDGMSVEGGSDLGNWFLVGDFRQGSKRYLLLCEKSDRTRALYGLTQAERKVVDRAARGLCTKEIAAELKIAAATVRVLLMRAVRKCGVSSRAELIELWPQAGISSTDEVSD